MTPVVKTQLRILAIIAFVILTVLSISTTVQFFGNRSEAARQEQNDTEVQFWRTLGGVESSSSVSAKNTLAKDLRLILDDPQALNDFRGDANLYGGITSEIGYDPFVGANCSECGPLSRNFRTKVDLVAQGELDKVVSLTQTTYDTGYTFTLFGLSVFVQFIYLYIIVGFISYVAAHRIMNQRYQTDTQMLLSLPALYVYKKFKEHRSGRKDDSEIRRQFPDYCKLLDDVDESIASLPAGEDRSVLKRQRDEVRIELLRQVHSSDNARSKTEMKELADALDMLSTTLKARSEAREELDQWP